MTELVFLTDNMVTTSSRIVAEYFGMEHKTVLRALDNKKGSAQNCATLDSMFFETTYVHEQNKQEYREVIMNRDGFSLLAMGFTGAKALQFQLKFINEFTRMEAELKSKQLPTSYKDALLALVAEVEAKEKAELELLVEKGKTESLTVAVGESVEYISIKRVASWTRTHHSAYSWRKLKNESDYMQYDIKKEVDSNYGTTNCYHVDVWKSIYPELSDLIDEECNTTMKKLGVTN